MTKVNIEGSSAPRGRIYDRNYNLLVDNIGQRVIYYKKNNDITSKEEIDLAYLLADKLEIDYSPVQSFMLKNFWILLNEDRAKAKITEEEYDLLKKRKMTSYEIETLKKDRITDKELNEFDNIDREASYIYYLMNKGYSYEEKAIKSSNIKESEYAFIAENVYKLKGIGIKLDWKRNYIYGSTLIGLLGSVSSQSQGIPYELKDYYLAKGYNLNDRVGVSSLEYQYDDLLKGKKAKYKYNNGMLVLNEESVRGYDIVLSIDIKLQLEVEKIIEEEVKKAKKEPNTQYFNRNMVVISDPNNGEIIAMAAKQFIDNNGELKVYDYSSNISTTPIIMGSVVKGASMTVGYKSGAIDIGTKMLDECIKIMSTPKKCSWRSNLGVLNDINALRLSSNSYQFKTAIKVAKANYKYNSPLVVDESAFKTYRDIFSQYGLGVNTGIDLPIESTGYKGDSKVAGHLLDFAIGQYDTYTALQLSQYINTIANNGKRMQLKLLKEVYKPSNNDNIGELDYKNNDVLLNTVDIDLKYIKRIQEGFKLVMGTTGLGYGYINLSHKPAGKTGTSQSFYDSDFDGKIDKETITSTFAGYAPYDSPKMSIVVISPDVSHIYGRDYLSQVNRRISKKIADKYFEIYK